MTEQHVIDNVRRRWLEVLDIEQVADGDDFFLTGGHSLLAVRLTAALREDLDARIPLSAIFELRTLKGFADRVADLVGPAV
ncbi:phosphopantetheine-binding protein [Actinomadura macra]|uniref:phosphopantetheine-binding protein n=1 Tax=Actinomadura macra TaxID=46164 RepID=UPI000A052C4B|nr:phosphopantetheine-binding protein [Actinomadura macra]